jgi:hypothetical protein
MNYLSVSELPASKHICASLLMVIESKYLRHNPWTTFVEHYLPFCYRPYRSSFKNAFGSKKRQIERERKTLKRHADNLVSNK